MDKKQEFDFYQLKVELCSNCNRFINDHPCNIKKMLKCVYNKLEKWRQYKEKIHKFYLRYEEGNNE